MAVNDDRMIGLPEVIARTGLSRSFFYCGKSQGTLDLPLKNVAGRLQCREEDLEAWMASRRILDASRTTYLGKELLALIGPAKDDPALSAEKCPALFAAVSARLDEALSAAIETMKTDRRISVDEFVDRYDFIVDQVDAELTDGLPEPAQMALAPLFYDRVVSLRAGLFSYVASEYKRVVAENLRSILYGIKHQAWKTREEKEESVRFYLPEEDWTLAGYSSEERARMIDEAVSGSQAHGGEGQ